MGNQARNFATLTDGVLAPFVDTTQETCFIDTALLLERMPTDLELYNTFISP